jgi:predicted RNase H-like HicB family nuclease
MVTSADRKPLGYYLNLKYPVTIEEAPEGGYFAEIKDLPGCYAEGRTVKEAFELIGVARKMWLEVAYDDGQDIPLPGNDDRQYFVILNFRVPKDLHGSFDVDAYSEVVSLYAFWFSC